MKRDGLTGHMIIRNGIVYDFPFVQGVMSVLPIVDSFIILEAYSDLDDTYEKCLELAERHRKVRIIRGEWDGDEPEGREYLKLSRLTNQCIDAVETTWHIAVQGDEIIHEDGLVYINRIVEGKTVYGDQPKAVMFPFVHLVGRFDTQFPFVYQSSVRMAKTGTSWRSHKDAWTMKCMNPEKDNFMIVANNSPYIHYGFVGNLMARIMKERAFQDLFHAEGFPDPRVVEMAEGSKPISMAYLFEDAKSRGLFTPYKGTHPAVMEDWIKERRQHEELFD